MGDNEEDGGALPPAAPAYDFRTGKPLNDPGEASAPWRPQDDADDLGIWAPRAEPYQAAPPTPASAPYQQPGTDQHPSYQQAGYQQPGTYQQPGYQQPGTYQQPGYQHPGTYQHPGATAEHPPLPPHRSNRAPVVILLLGALLAVGALIAVLVLTRDTSSTPTGPTAAPGSSGVAPSSSSPSAGPTSSGTSDATSDATAARAAFARDVDGILGASAEGRRQVIAAINGVRNSCDVSPSEATSSLDDVIANRRTVLAQAGALSTPDAATATAKADLVQALTASLDANQAYQRWLDNALAAYPDASPTGCPPGGVPTDSDYDAATAASGRATSAKQQFVGVYNPIATQAGLATWTADQF